MHADNGAVHSYRHYHYRLTPRNLVVLALIWRPRRAAVVCMMRFGRGVWHLLRRRDSIHRRKVAASAPWTSNVQYELIEIPHLWLLARELYHVAVRPSVWCGASACIRTQACQNRQIVGSV
jgi:hypothetical protein